MTLLPEFIRNLISLKNQASQVADAQAKAVAAYNGNCLLPHIIDVYTGSTITPADDGARAAVMTALDEVREVARNGAELLRGAVAIAEATALQLEAVEQLIQRLEKEPLKKVLEG